MFLPVQQEAVQGVEAIVSSWAPVEQRAQTDAQDVAMGSTP